MVDYDSAVQAPQHNCAAENGSKTSFQEICRRYARGMVFDMHRSKMGRIVRIVYSMRESRSSKGTGCESLGKS
jgi:hypothetical protein